jgi:Transposase protein.
VFIILKDNVQTLSDKDHVCYLMFDTMLIRARLHFNQKIDCIEGFEDLESHGRTSNIANHAPVFMLHGLRKKWKRPVSFYLIRGSTKGEMLVNFLMEALDASHNAGLVVVATVCDMDANIVTALKQLGVSEKTPFFRFHDQEIAAMFDPPHLHKCTHNLYLKHDVTNVGLGAVVNGQ